MQKIQRYTGFVALLDVLGFKELVNRDDHQAYMQMVAELIDEPATNQPLQYVLFSDTVVINTKKGDEENLWTLLRACSLLFAALLNRQVPVRGAVAYGEFDRSIGDERGVIVAGRPIVEAYQYELKQNWLGIMLCPSVLRVVPDLATKCNFPPAVNGQETTEYLRALRWPLVLAVWGGIPFHVDSPLTEPTSQEGFALLPMSKSVTSFAEVKAFQDSTLRALHQMKMIAPDPASQRKYRDTITFLSNAFDQWRTKVPGWQ